MSDSLDQQLLGHLLGALDDDEQEALDARLEADDACCRALAGWRRRLAALEALRPDYDPPRGLAERTCLYVAGHVPMVRPQTPRMTPAAMISGRASGARWLDLAVAALLFATATAMLFPAISQSRLQARVATCQEGLAKLGRALIQYSDQHGSPVTQVAVAGQLTDFGASAVRQLRSEHARESSRALFPDTWLAAQGVLHRTPRDSAFLQPKVLNHSTSFGNRRNGTDDWQPPLSAAPTPLLADAPSAELPSEAIETHGGRGRNVLFGDGRAAFLPAASNAPLDWVVSSRESLAGQEAEPLLHFVSGR